MRTGETAPTTAANDEPSLDVAESVARATAFERARRASEAQHALIAQHTRDLICLHDADGRIVYASPSVEHLLGYSPTDLVGLGGESLVHPEDWARLDARSRRREIGDAPGSPITCRVRARRGAYRWLEILTQPIFDDDGAVVGVQSSSRDVTERVQAEMERDALLDQAQAARAEAEASLARISRLQALTAALSTARTSAQIAAAVVEHGFAAVAVHAAVVAAPVDDGSRFEALAERGQPVRIDPTWRSFPRDAATPLADAVRRGEPIVVPAADEAAIDSPDEGAAGRSGVAAVALPMRTDERTLGVIGLLVDSAPLADTDWAFLLTVADLGGQALERARLYEADRRLRARVEAERDWLQQVIDVFPAGIAIVNANGDLVVRNAAANAILGRELVGRVLRTDSTPSAFMRRPDGSDVPSCDLPLQRAFLHGHVVTGEQLVTTHSEQGREVPLLVNAAPLRDAAGGVVGAVAALQDITAIKESEKARDDFLSSVSHDLRAPLTVIQGLARGLQRQARRSNTDESNRFADRLEGVLTSSERMTTMLDELVEAARAPVAPTGELHRWPVDLVALLRRLATEHNASSDKHAVAFNSPLETLVGLYDESRLARAVANLIDNAVKYSPAGGRVGVGLRRESGAKGDDAVIEVSDEGVGIPTADLPKLFERGHRGRNVIGRFSGTGLGLAGARDIVEQHGGSVAVVSQEGAGSTFSIRLPLAAGVRRPSR